MVAWFRYIGGEGPQAPNGIFHFRGINFEVDGPAKRVTRAEDIAKLSEMCGAAFGNDAHFEEVVGDEGDELEAAEQKKAAKDRAAARKASKDERTDEEREADLKRASDRADAAASALTGDNVVGEKSGEHIVQPDPAPQGEDDGASDPGMPGALDNPKEQTNLALTKPGIFAGRRPTKSGK